MKYSEIPGILEETGYPVAYYEWPENEVPALPYIVYWYPQSDDFSADDGTYLPIDEMRIELYTETKSFAAERNVEEVLQRHGIRYAKTETRLDKEQMYGVLYVSSIIAEDRPQI